MAFKCPDHPAILTKTELGTRTRAWSPRWPRDGVGDVLSKLEAAYKAVDWKSSTRTTSQPLDLPKLEAMRKAARSRCSGNAAKLRTAAFAARDAATRGVRRPEEQPPDQERRRARRRIEKAADFMGVGATGTRSAVTSRRTWTRRRTPSTTPPRRSRPRSRARSRRCATRSRRRRSDHAEAVEGRGDDDQVPRPERAHRVRGQATETATTSAWTRARPVVLRGHEHYASKECPSRTTAGRGEEGPGRCHGTGRARRGVPRWSAALARRKAGRTGAAAAVARTATGVGPSCRAPSRWPSRAAGRGRRRSPAARCPPRCPGRCRSSRRPSPRRRTRTRTRAASSPCRRPATWRGQMPITPPQVRLPISGPSFISLKMCAEDVAVGARPLVGQRHHRAGDESLGYGSGAPQRGKS